MNNIYELIVMGASAGGYEALTKIISGLSDDFKMPIALVLHRHPSQDSYLPMHFKKVSLLDAMDVEDKTKLKPKTIFIAPADYHLLIDENKVFNLSVDLPEVYCRPSIDVLFESAAAIFEKKLVGILLTGANSDGARGLHEIKQMGGTTIVQDPTEAEVNCMPQSALDIFEPDHIMKISDVISYMNSIDKDASVKVNNE